MTPLETVELFVNNLIEYVENIAGGDYARKEDAITAIAGNEKEFWEALNILARGSAE